MTSFGSFGSYTVDVRNGLRKNMRPHKNVAKKVHRDFCKKNGLEHTEKQYEHVPGGVVENEEVKTFCGISIFSVTM